MLKEIIDTLENIEHVKAYLVGGCVRDKILNLYSKDIDIEVFGLDIDTLIHILKPFGKVSSVGKSFGVVKLTTLNDDFDFSLPRREVKVGKGHKCFNIEVDQNITVKEASKRRDFTFNSLMMNSKGEVIDNFGGISDLEEGILKHTSLAFIEDPLRVLRGFQFAGRFDFTMAPKTIILSQMLLKEFDTISIERIWIELWKWATKSIKPSKGLDVLEQTKWITKFPELNALKGCFQNPQWHPEGDVWEHTKQVCDAAVDICKREGIEGERKGIIVLAALLHDVGKPNTTHKNDGDNWVSPKHASIGANIAENFLGNLLAPTKVIEQVTALVSNHMWVTSLKTMTKPIVNRMINKLSQVGLTIQDLAIIIEADVSGRSPLPSHCPKLIKEAMIIAETIGNEIKPIIQGRHLIEMGLKPSPKFGIILSNLFERQLDGEFVTLEDGLIILSHLRIEGEVST